MLDDAPNSEKQQPEKNAKIPPKLIQDQKQTLIINKPIQVKTQQQEEFDEIFNPIPAKAKNDLLPQS